MMIVLYVFLGLLLFLFFLCLLPAQLRIEYGSEFNIKFRYMFFTIPLNKSTPKKEKKEKKSTKKNTSKNGTSNKKEVGIFEKFGAASGLSGALAFLTELTSIITKMVFTISSHIVINPLVIDFRVADEDSSKTAVKYGKACSVVFPFVQVLGSACKLKKYKINVSPNFLTEKSLAYIKVYMSIRPIYIIFAVIIAFVKYLKNIVMRNRMVKNNEG